MLLINVCIVMWRNGYSDDYFIYRRFPKPLRTFAAVVAIIIMIIGLAGNLLTIVALCKYPKVRNVAAAFIIRYDKQVYIHDFVIKIIYL